MEEDWSSAHYIRNFERQKKVLCITACDLKCRYCFFYFVGRLTCSTDWWLLTTRTEWRGWVAKRIAPEHLVVSPGLCPCYHANLTSWDPRELCCSCISFDLPHWPTQCAFDFLHVPMIWAQLILILVHDMDDDCELLILMLMSPLSDVMIISWF